MDLTVAHNGKLDKAEYRRGDVEDGDGGRHLGRLRVRVMIERVGSRRSGEITKITWVGGRRKKKTYSTFAREEKGKHSLLNTL